MNNTNIKKSVFWNPAFPVAVISLAIIGLFVLMLSITTFNENYGMDNNTVVGKYCRMGYAEVIVDRNNSTVSTGHPEIIELQIVVNHRIVNVPVDILTFQQTQIGDIFIHQQISQKSP